MVRHGSTCFSWEDFRMRYCRFVLQIESLQIHSCSLYLYMFVLNHFVPPFCQTENPTHQSNAFLSQDAMASVFLLLTGIKPVPQTPAKKNQLLLCVNSVEELLNSEHVRKF